MKLQDLAKKLKKKYPKTASFSDRSVVSAFLKRNPKAKEMVKNAAILADGRLFEGKSHIEALQEAKKEGIDTSKIDKEKDGLFRTTEGRIINRKQSLKEFGVEHSEDIPAQKRFILVTNDFVGLGFAVQEQQKNGSEVMIAFKPKEPPEDRDSYEIQGKGLVKTVSLDDLMEIREYYRDCYWIWDGNHNYAEGELLRSEGFKVFGGTKFQYTMENDREFGLEFAQSCGLLSPEFKEFTSKEEGIAFLEEHEDRSYVFKPNDEEDSALTTVPMTDDPKAANLEMRAFVESMGIDDFILQEKVSGVEVNVECFYQNGEPVFADANLENKRGHVGELGCATGCAFDVCWEVDINSRLVQETVGKMYPRLKEIGYTGFADCNVIIGDDNVYFLEFCFRAGYNAHPNLFTTLSYKTFLQTCADLTDGIFEPNFKSGFGASITLFCGKPKQGLPVYISELSQDMVYIVDGYFEDEMLKMGGMDKEIVFVMGHDYTIDTAFEDALEIAKKVKFVNKYYRTDPNKTDYPNSPIRRYEALQTMKYV